MEKKLNAFVLSCEVRYKKWFDAINKFIWECDFITGDCRLGRWLWLITSYDDAREISRKITVHIGNKYSLGSVVKPWKRYPRVLIMDTTLSDYELCNPLLSRSVWIDEHSKLLW